MTSKRALFMLMINQKKVRDGFKLVDLNTMEKVSIEECYEIVMEDLDRLEKLEKAFDTLSKDDEKAKKLLSLEIEKNRKLQIIEEKLEKENQELKEKVNHFEKGIEVMQNSSKLDCTHMFDNCEKLTPLTEKKEEKKTSLEAFEEIIKVCNLYHQQITNAGNIESVSGYPIKKIKEDLEILECFRKIPKQDLKEFIDWQIRYEKNLNSWLEACNADLAKEDPTKHLIKIKEWLEE